VLAGVLVWAAGAFEDAGPGLLFADLCDPQPAINTAPSASPTASPTDLLRSCLMTTPISRAPGPVWLGITY
jgi:hypothetical protein